MCHGCLSVGDVWTSWSDRKGERWEGGYTRTTNGNFQAKYEVGFWVFAIIPAETGVGAEFDGKICFF